MALLPLEKVFERKAQETSEFPRMDLNYAIQYQGLVNYLRANIYNLIDPGLAANSNAPGFYTAHNSEHFDEVVRCAGYLLGVRTGDEEIKLTPYELYVLLVAIRVHDVGNVYGRENHEKRCFSILRDCGAAAGNDDSEKKNIANIAQAHGGKTTAGHKDTISELPIRESVGNGYIRPRLIASIVRFADEICENRSRAAGYLIQHGNIPKHSEIFHYYADAISANTFEDERITIRYTVKDKNIMQAWGGGAAGAETEVFLIDEILDRLEKMDNERRYCNRFSGNLYTVTSIRASIDIVNDNYDIVETIAIPELSDVGYPEDAPHNLKERLSIYCGAAFGQRLQAASREAK